MIGGTPPPVAAWLLKQLSKNDALVGDLTESYAAGHSRLWYWGQVLAGIATGAWRDSRERVGVAMQRYSQR